MRKAAKSAVGLFDQKNIYQISRIHGGSKTMPVTQVALTPIKTATVVTLSPIEPMTLAAAAVNPNQIPTTSILRMDKKLSCIVTPSTPDRIEVLKTSVF